MRISSIQPESPRGGNGGENSARAKEILYIDDQCLTRDCISDALAKLLPDLSIESRAKAQDLLPEDFRTTKFALVILHGHDGRLGIGTTAKRIGDTRIATELSILDRIAPDTPLVLLSDAESTQNIIEAFSRRRIRGYVPTTLPIKQVAEAIRFAWAGGTFVPLSIVSQWASPDAVKSVPSTPLTHESNFSPPTPLTPEIGNFSPRQREVLHRLWMGKANKAIAYELGMCESTVKVHIRQIMKRLRATNRTQVVVLTRPSSFDEVARPAPMQADANIRSPTNLPRAVASRSA
jgi:DNA-binding NarL/FixJ family response regulator